MRRRELTFVLLGVAVAALCFRLGVWQLARLEERQARNDWIRSRLALRAIDLTTGAVGEDLAYRRAEATGRWDPSYEIVLMNRARGGVPGAHLVTPLIMDDGGPALLVNRGWIPQEAASAQALSQYRAERATGIQGILRPSQEEPSLSFLADPTPSAGAAPRLAWRVLHIPSIQRQTPYPLAGLYLQLDTVPTFGLHPEPEAAIDLSDGPHLGYAVQWFLFGAIAVVGTGAWMWNRRRPAARPPGADPARLPP